MKLRTRIRALNATRQAPSSSGSRGLGLGFVMAFASKFVGEDKSRLYSTQEDATNTNLSEGDQPKSLFRLGQTARETIALLDAGDRAVPNSLANAHPRTFDQVNPSSLFTDALGRKASTQKLSFSNDELEELLNSQAEEKNFVSLADDSPIEITQSATGVSSGKGRADVESLPNFLDDEKSASLTDSVDLANLKNPLERGQQDASDASKPGAENNFFDEVLAQLDEHLQSLMIYFGGMQMASGGGLFGALSAGLSAAGANPSQIVSGAVIDGYVAGATVFADVNANGIQDVWEPFAITDANGAYRFETSLDLSTASIISLGGVDQYTGASIGYLIAPVGLTYVTPITTLLHYAQATQSGEQLLGALGISLDDLKKDPIETYKNGDAAAAAKAEVILKTGASILTTVSGVSALVSGVSGQSTEEANKTVFSKLVAKIQPNQVLDEALVGAVISESLPVGLAVNGALVTGAAAALSQVIGKLSNSSLQDCWTYASIGQTILTKEILDFSKGGLTSESITAWKDEIKQGYESRLNDLAQYQKTIVAQKINADKLSFKLNADEIKISFADPSGLNKKYSLLENDSILVQGGKLKLVDIESLSKTLPAGLVVSVDSASSRITVDATGIDSSKISSYGDFYFQYSASLESMPNDIGEGVFKIQLNPKPSEVKFLDTASNGTIVESDTAAPTKIELIKVLSLSSVGPGDTLILDGLPNGTVLKQENTTLGIKTEDAPLTISSDKLLLLDKLMLEINGNFSGDINLKATMTSRYGSAVSTQTAAGELVVKATLDGMLANSTQFEGAIRTLIEPKIRAYEDNAFGLINDTATKDQLIQLFKDPANYLIDADGSEQVQLSIGLPMNWNLLGAQGLPMTATQSNAGLNWYSFKAASPEELIHQLAKIQAIPQANFNGAFEIYAKFESYEVALPSQIKSGNPFLLLRSSVNPQPELLNFNDAKLLVSGTQRNLSSDPGVEVNIADVFNKSQIDALKKLDTDFVSLTIKVPNNYDIRLDVNSDDWYLAETLASGEKLYKLDGWALSKLNSIGLKPLKLVPALGVATDQVGIQLKVSAQAFTTSDAVALDVTNKDNGSSIKDIDVVIKPNLQLASKIAPSTNLIALNEAQTEAINPIEWQPLKKWVPLVQSNLNQSGSVNWVGIADVNKNLEFSIIKGDKITSITKIDGDYKISELDYADLHIKSKKFVSGAFKLNIRTSTEQSWGDAILQTESGSITVNGDIKPFSSGVTSFNLLKLSDWNEGQSVSLIELFKNEKGQLQLPTLNDITGEEILFEIEIAKAINITIDGQIKTGILGADGQRTYTLTESELRLATLSANKFISNNDLLDGREITVSVYSKENGVKSLPQVKSTDFDILPISNQPKLEVVKQNISNLLQGDDKVSLPIFVSSVDAGESLDARIYINNAPSDWIQPNGAIQSPISFYLSNSQQPLNYSYSKSEGLYIQISKDQLSLLPSLQISSSKDLRSDQITLTIEAGSTDAGSTRALIAQDVGLEIFKQVHAPEIYVDKRIESDLVSTDIQLKLVLPVEQQYDIDFNGVSILVIGVPNGDYFLNQDGLPIGASLGNQIWILKANDVFGEGMLNVGNSSAIASIKLVGEAQDGTLSFKTLVTDYLSGSSATALNNVKLPLHDPIIIDFDGNHTLTPSQEGLEIDLNPYSVGKETVHDWFTGSFEGGNPRGIGVFVKEIVPSNTRFEVTYSNIFASIEELNNYGVGNAELWLNTNGDQYVDSGELILSSQIDEYYLNSWLTLDLEKSINSSGYTLIPAIYSDTSSQILPTIYSANLKLVNHVSECKVTLSNVSGSPLGSANAYAINEDEAYKSTEYSQNGVAYAFKIQYRFEPNEQDGAHFVKLYGVPNGALLDKGTFVQLDDQTAFWLIEAIDESAINIAIKSLPVNFVGVINLTAESITSYITENGSSVRWEGVTDEFKVDVLPVPDTPIFPDLKSSKIDLIEGTELYFSDLQIQAYSQDAAESVYYKLSNIPNGTIVKINELVLHDIDQRFFNQDEINLVCLDFPDFYKNDGSLKVTAYSQYPDGLRSNGIEKTIDYHFITRADGVSDQSIEIADTIFEGDNIQIHSSAKPNDPGEKIIYEYWVGGSQVAANGILGDAQLVTVNQKQYKIFHVNPTMSDSFDGVFNTDYSIKLNPFFNGEMEIIQRAASYDELSGEISEYSELGARFIQISPVLGAANNSYAISYFQNNAIVDKISLKEGSSAEFGLKITSFDSNESFMLNNAEMINSISNPIRTNNALGNREFSFSISTDYITNSTRGLTLELEVEEGGIFKSENLIVDYKIIKGPTQPHLETVDDVRLFLDAEDAVSLFDTNSISPAIKSLDSGDDVVSYQLDNLPVGIQLTNAKVLSKSKDERFATYSINSSQLSNVKFLVLSAAALTDSPNAFAWSAVNTEPTTGEQAISGSQNIFLANKISIKPLTVDSFSNDILVASDSLLNFKFVGGFNGESISVQAGFKNGQGFNPVSVQTEEIKLSNSTVDSIFHFDINSQTPNFSDFFSSATLKTNWNTLEYGQDAGEYSVNLRLLPNPSNWLISTGSTEVRELFQDGYFANVNLKSRGFNFIDPEYGVMVNEWYLVDDDSIDVSRAINIYGTDADDLIIAGNQSSILFGANGFNELHGSSFNDIMIAGNKTDLMYGGAGSDIYQVALDLDNESTSRDQMDLVLSNFLNLNYSQSVALSQEINSIHESVGDSIWSSGSDTKYHFNAIVGDYSRSNGNADRLAFTHGSETTEISTHIIKGETWGGHTDLIYSFAKDFADTNSGQEMSDITAVLMIPDSGLDIQLLDLHNNGISKT